VESQDRRQEAAGAGRFEENTKDTKDAKDAKDAEGNDGTEERMIMSDPISRRDFLKTAPIAAGAVAATSSIALSATQSPSSVLIGKASYRPTPDSAIQPQRYFDVTLTDGFWKPKVDVNASVTIPFEVQKRADGGGRGFGGGVLEAAMLSLRTHPNPALQAQVDARVRAMAQSAPSGNGTFEIAATYFNVTGRRDLLDPALKAADALYDDFRTRNPPFSGGERDAMNCVQLYRVTHERKHLDLAKHYLDIRGLENSVNRSRHNQSYKPVLEQREAVGHAVNGVTLMVSMADVGVLTGLKDYLAAAQVMWADAVERKMYVTGGVGTTGNEGFGEAYSLPNISAYAETCAVLMFITLNHRLFLATGDAKYIDVMERGMYNNALSGVAVAGNRYFYVNRLASAGDGRDERWERASLECCPPNLVRFLASMPQYIYAQGPGGAVYVNLYVSSDTTFRVNGQRLALSVQSGMPWEGASGITIATDGDVKGAIKLRIPGWTRSQPAPGGLYRYAGGADGTVTVAVNRSPVTVAPDRFGYVTIDRVWKSGDRIDVALPVSPRYVVADERVKEDRGKVAVERGPVVYCAEGPKAEDLVVDPSQTLTASVDRDLFGGVTVVRTSARSATTPAAAAAGVTLIPYYLWANRGKSPMSVWLPSREYAPGDVGPSGGWIFCVNPNFATDGWRYLEAAPFDQSAGAKWGCFRRLIPGARGTAVGTGRQNTRDMLEACPDPSTAAQLCAALDVSGIRGWFLPSRDELTLMYKHLRATGVANFGDRGVADNFSYWASSQQTADMAGHVDFADLGRVHFDDKDFPRRVRAIRAW
jgi:DUF1680 family protein